MTSTGGLSSSLLELETTVNGCTHTIQHLPDHAGRALHSCGHTMLKGPSEMVMNMRAQVPCWICLQGGSPEAPAAVSEHSHAALWPQPPWTLQFPWPLWRWLWPCQPAALLLPATSEPPAFQQAFALKTLGLVGTPGTCSANTAAASPLGACPGEEGGPHLCLMHSPLIVLHHKANVLHHCCEVGREHHGYLQVLAVLCHGVCRHETTSAH